ncbi:MAG: Gfo/Idh/MocA family protein [Planctomycetaceae bacterium]
MSDTNPHAMNRREMLHTTGRIAAAGALAGAFVPFVHAAASDAIQLALVGCGGRGTGAAGDAMSSTKAPTRLVAMADVFPDRLVASHDTLKSTAEFEAKVNVADDHRFVGFDAYKHAMDALKPGDVVILTTPPAFRWVHFKYAIDKGLNVFMEKPITVDGPSTRKMLALGEEAKKKNLKVAIGLMCRHCPARQELFNRIRNGELGDLTMLRAYRMHPPYASTFVKRKPDDISELMYQIRHFHSFLWASGGCYSDYLIHNIDECCWMKDAWPVEASAVGGRHYRGDYVDQNFDNYAVEYTFADGAKLFLKGRYIDGCDNHFASYAHGTKGSAVISQSGHWPSTVRIFKGQKIVARGRDDSVVWAYPQPETQNPYRVEWNDLIEAIVTDKPYSEVERGAKASLVTALGRMAAHTGKTVTFDEMLNCEHEFAPDVDKFSSPESPAPVVGDANGRYPVPQPGIITKREYA